MWLQKIYRWSRSALILSIIVFLLCTLVALVAPPRYMGLYDTATYQARIVLFIIPIAALVCALSGLPRILQRKKTARAGAETRMSHIMQRLTPDDRDYLQQRLDDRIIGIGTDGELVSLDELTDQHDASSS
jgi:hypothetical protein